MVQTRDDIEALLYPFDPRLLDRYPDSAFACDPEGRLLYVNAAWRAFAADNGGEPAITARWPLGSNVFSAIPEPLQLFYRELFASAAAGRLEATGPIGHSYECSSPTLFRRFQMSLYPLADQRGLLVVNACEVERPHELAVHPPHPVGDVYRDRHGVAHQCSHCRRIGNQLHPGRWDWVPAWVARCPPRTSHTLCEPCFAFYYGERLP